MSHRLGAKRKNWDEQGKTTQEVENTTHLEKTEE